MDVDVGFLMMGRGCKLYEWEPVCWLGSIADFLDCET